MKNSINPLAAENAEFWLSRGIVPIPIHEDGSYLVEPNLWAQKSDQEILLHFARHPTQKYKIMAPEGWVIIVARDRKAFSLVRPNLKKNGIIERHSANFIHGEMDVAIVFCERISEANFDHIKDKLGIGNEIIVPTLSYSIATSDILSKDLPDAEEMESVPPTPLDEHSLLGFEDEMERFAVKTIALLGFVILMGQFGLIYAQPNTGKTLLTIALLLQAVEEGRLDPRMCYYINADDNNQGIVQKLLLFREMGAHTLIPGHKNFDPEKLIDLVQTMINNGQCVGVVIILDTLKCFIDLMDKKRSTQFAKVVRQFVIAGGTFIGLAHTNKNPGGNGKPVYAGTSDFYEACDAACYLLPVETTAQGDKVVKFELFKKRGGGNRDEAYSYSGSNDVSYDQLVASVQRIDPDQMHKYEQSAQLVTDQLVIDAITASLKQTTQQKMALAKDVSATTKASRRQVIEILERYAGDNPTKHKWDFVVAERGAKVFALHPATDS